MVIKPRTLLRNGIAFVLTIALLTLAAASVGCCQLGSSNGQATGQAWVSRYDGGVGDDDGAQAIALDSLGNICVTGYSWGNHTSVDYATIKYDPAGRPLWVARYNGPASDQDWAFDLTVDKSDDVYVTGWSLGNGTEADFATIKYNSDGQQLWVARYDGPVSGYDLAYAIALDYSGNVYVTGWSQGNGTDADCVTIKYNSDGQQLWVARYNGPAGGEDKSYALVTDGWSNVYVTGSSRGVGTGADCVTIKYDSEGNQLWVARYNGPANGDDQAESIAVDHWGDICVTGWSESGGAGKDYVTIKYNGIGAQSWVARYDGPAHANDSAYAMGLDPLDNIYVTGSSWGNDTEADYATVKYDSGGNRLWVARYNGPIDLEDTAKTIALDSLGNPYVSGWSRGANGRYDFATVKYDTAGTQLWAARYDGPAGGHDKVYAMAVDTAGDVYVTGRSSGTTTFYDYATVKYVPR
jgi:uncharacterized delta-60 repeat protein